MYLAMKLYKSIFAIALVASAFASCQKIEEDNSVNTTKTVSFTATTLETKTAFGEPDGTRYPTLWTANDEKVKVSLNYASAKDAEVTPATDFKTANFSVEIEDDKTNAYTFYSVSPASAAIAINSNYKSWNLEVPSAQKPTETSVDEKAQILIAQTEEFSEFPTSVKMNYSHFTAYGKMSLLNLELGDATINSISLTASKNWAGRWYYYIESGKVDAQSGSSATITLETNATENIWFACAPVDLSGETLKVTVNTTNGPLVKEIALPANTKFESGVINKFAVDMTGIGFEESKVYSLVTDLSSLTADSEVIIVAADANVAMSTAQNTNNRGQASVTKSDKTITDPGEDVQVFTLKKGSKDNTIAFYTGEAYIYAASSDNNWLRTQSDLDANASFTVELSNGEAALVAQGANTRNNIRYNSTSSVFSCYASGQGAVSIYKLDGSGTDTPLIVVDDNEYTITVVEAENGTVEASATAAKKGTEITLTVTPDEGYALDALTVKDAENNDITVNDNIFTMPASNVTVTASFKVAGNTPDSETIVFSELNLENGVQYSDPFDGGNFTVTFGGGDNDGKYYTTGTGIRTYGDGTITIESSEYKIAEILFTWSGSNKPTGDVASPTGYSSETNTWTGSANKVVLTRPSGSGHWRLQSIKVTYE